MLSLGSPSAVYCNFFTQTRVRTEVIFSLVQLSMGHPVIQVSQRISIHEKGQLLMVHNAACTIATMMIRPFYFR
jgi:hypothetical protein